MFLAGSMCVPFMGSAIFDEEDVWRMFINLCLDSGDSSRGISRGLGIMTSFGDE